MSSCMFLVSSLFFFCLVPCGRLSWLLVSFWAHVNIVHHIISYHITAEQGRRLVATVLYRRSEVGGWVWGRGLPSPLWVKYGDVKTIGNSSQSIDGHLGINAEGSGELHV